MVKKKYEIGRGGMGRVDKKKNNYGEVEGGSFRV